MPHKETIKYKGKKVKVITFDTEVHLTRGKKHALRDVERLMDEEERYKRTGKLTKKRSRKKG